MSEAENITEPTTPIVEQKKAGRSASYPALTTVEAFNFTNKIYDKFSNVEVTRKEMANVLKVHPNSISREVAAAAAYGLFDKSLAKGETDFKYKVTVLFTDILRPDNEKQKKMNLLIAFGKPKLYQELITKFDCSVIPEELPNTLIKHHGITIAASKEVADIFLNAGSEVGAISESRVLNYKVALSSIAKTQIAEEIDAEPVIIDNNNVVAKIKKVDFDNTDNDKKVPIHLTNDKIAYLMYPNDISGDDIELIEHHLKGVVLRLKFEGKLKKENEDISIQQNGVS